MLREQTAMSNKITSLFYVCLVGVFTLGSSSSFAITSGCPDPNAYPLNGCSLPETVNGSFPYFYQNVNVSYKQKKKSDDFNVKAKFMKGSGSSFLYVAPDDVLTITKTGFKFDAKVVDGEASGKIKITGSIDDLGIKGTLMTADLKGTWGSDGTLIGFDTTNIQCNEAIDAYVGHCTTEEVIYLNLLDAIGPDAGARKIKTAGVAVTSVPVPAAAWLFGSGLLGLIAVSRRRGDRA
jgi:hypothetical protein